MQHVRNYYVRKIDTILTVKDHTNMEISTLLTTIGIPKKAAHVYLSALQSGAVTMTDLARITGIKRPSVYLMIDTLIARGLITTERRGRKTYYRSEHPQRILQTLRSRTREMERVIPELEAMYYDPRGRPRVTVTEGLPSVLAVYEDMYAAMGRSGEILFFTDIGSLEVHLPDAIDAFIERLRTLPASYRLRELDRESPEAHAYVRRLHTVKGAHHHIRLLDPSLFPFEHTDTLIFENKTALFSFKKEIFTVVIESQQIADTHRALFDAAWETGKDV